MSAGLNASVVVYTLKIRKPGACAKVNTADISVRARHVENGEAADDSASRRT